jgi:hypothetical protein
MLWIRKTQKTAIVVVVVVNNSRVLWVVLEAPSLGANQWELETSHLSPSIAEFRIRKALLSGSSVWHGA